MKKTTETNQTVEVLYQRMGDRWYAFSVVDDEVFVGTVPESALDEEADGPTGNA